MKNPIQTKTSKSPYNIKLIPQVIINTPLISDSYIGSSPEIRPHRLLIPLIAFGQSLCYTLSEYCQPLIKPNHVKELLKYHKTDELENASIWRRYKALKD